MSTKISNKIMAILERENANFAPGCSEPGYDDKLVILANWNNISDKIFDYLEHKGYACEWEDEWLECDQCYKVFRSSPDSYSWEMYGAIFDGFALCGDCIDPVEYLEGMENKPHSALTCTLFRKIDPAEYGYTRLQDGFENGFHPGQDDDPVKILAKLLQDDPSGKFIFVIDGQGQFDLEFSVYKKDVSE